MNRETRRQEKKQLKRAIRRVDTEDLTLGQLKITLEDLATMTPAKRALIEHLMRREDEFYARLERTLRP